MYSQHNNKTMLSKYVITANNRKQLYSEPCKCIAFDFFCYITSELKSDIFVIL